MATTLEQQIGTWGQDGLTQYPDGDKEAPSVYADYVRALWTEQDESLRPFHLVWMQNLLYLTGRQWWTPTERGTFEPPRVPAYRELPVTNLTLPFFKTFLSKAIRLKPTWTVVAASDEPRDLRATRFADELLRAKWVEIRGSRTYRRGLAWTILTGNGYLLPYWNTSTGKIKQLWTPVEVPVLDKRGAPMMDDLGEPMIETVNVPCDEEGEPYLDRHGRPIAGKKPHAVDEGEIGFRAYSPWQVRVNPEATCDEDVEWFIIAEPITLREAARKYPDIKEDLEPEDVSDIEYASSAMNGYMSNSASEFSPSPRDLRSEDLPKCLRLCYYERPSPEYPEGRYWESVGKHLVTEPQGLPDGLWPGLIHLKDVDLPGRYHGMATFEAVVGLNRQYNERNGKILEHDNVFIQGKWMIPSASGVKKGMITMQGGECIKYVHPYKPEMADVKPLPAHVYAERERILVDFDRCSGIRQVSQGGTTGGVTAGVAIAQLQEADDTDLAAFMLLSEESMAELAGYMLKLIKENYDDERMYYAAGQGGRRMVKAFQASDLEGAVDVVPQQGSSLTLTKMARQAIIMDLLKAMPNLFLDKMTGQVDTALLGRLLEIGGLESLYESQDIDIQEAMREEDAFSTLGLADGASEEPQVAPWQNHMIHIDQHRKTLASGEHLEWSEPAQQAFMQHFAQHQMAMMPPAPPEEEGEEKEKGEEKGGPAPTISAPGATIFPQGGAGAQAMGMEGPLMDPALDDAMAGVNMEDQVGMPEELMPPDYFPPTI